MTTSAGEQEFLLRAFDLWAALPSNNVEHTARALVAFDAAGERLAAEMARTIMDGRQAGLRVRSRQPRCRRRSHGRKLA